MVAKYKSNLSVLYPKFTGWSINPAQFLIFIILLAALMNSYLFVMNPNMGADALYYHSAFHSVISGRELANDYGDDWSPGYGLLTYLFYLIIGDIEYSSMLVSSFAYILMIPTTFFAVDYMFGKRSALLATLLITFWPILISFSYVSLSDCVYAFFILFSFALYFSFR